MKLTGWLFEEQQEYELDLPVEEQLGILSDYITGDLTNVFPGAKLEKETDSHVLWNLNKQKGIILAYRFDYKIPIIHVYLNKQYNNDTVVAEQIKQLTYESFKKQLIEFFKTTINKLEQISSFDRFLEQIKQEVVQYFGSNIVKTDEKGVYVRYKIPNTMFKVEVTNNQVNLHIRFKTVDAQGNEDLGADMFIKLGDSFKSKISKNWDKINQVLENSFRLVGAN